MGHTRTERARAGPLELGGVLVASSVPVLPAVLVWVLSHRYTHNPRRIFLGLSLGILLNSFAPVLALPTGPATRVALGIMHVVSAALIVGALWWRSG